ncbi:unnamed protein product [Adineta ricciae]|uniref:aralkylamine N-acetyltransferase n=1 Tax=Adineta ricciae TaxID=249248 RepID=A0A814PC58_ADIRI|nr:unnamed protein product [Adineta ricciae]CAF1506236.1 unnamed protein product [Adineta ricciae]
MTSSTTFDIHLMTEDDYDQVLSLLLNSFFQDEPITRCIQLTDTLDFAKSIIQGCLKDKCSFVACHPQTKQIAAVCLNEIIYKNNNEENIQWGEKIRFIFEILSAVHKKRSIFEEFSADKLLHIYIISVDQSARGHGLASKLIGKSIEYGKELQMIGAYAEATNLISLKSFKQQKFDVFDELIYVNYNPQRLAGLKGEIYDRCYLVARKL